MIYSGKGYGSVLVGGEWNQNFAFLKPTFSIRLLLLILQPWGMFVVFSSLFVFLFLHEIIFCEDSLESPQHMFSWRNKKNIDILRLKKFLI